MARRVVVFIDYENMHRCARDAFGRSNGHFWPWALGERLVLVRNTNGRNDTLSELHQVRVYRGLPSPRRQPQAHAANEAQKVAWDLSVSPTSGGGRLHVFRRSLRYPKGWPNAKGVPQEKGVDVALAADLVQMTYQGDFDVAIVCSHDTDLAPALDAVRTVKTAQVHLEVASWSPLRRIGFTGETSKPWCHRLSADDFDAVQDATDYRMPVDD